MATEKKRPRKLRVPRKASPVFGQYSEERSRQERENRNCAFLLLRNNEQSIALYNRSPALNCLGGVSRRTSLRG